MTLQDLLLYSRFLCGEPVAGRFQDSDVTNCINVSQQQLMLDLAWPEALMTTTTTSAQEYTLPPILQIIEAYIGQPGQFGQLLVPTTLARLEGIPLQFYDQTANQQQPQWTQVTALPYPISNWDIGFPTSSGNAPYSIGQRPVRYLRGGNIGLVPPPTAGATLTVRAIPFPNDLALPTDVSLFPEVCKRAIGCHTAMQLIESDNPEDPNAGAGWMQKYQLEAGRLSAWKDRLDLNMDQTPQFLTYRSYFLPPVPHTAGIGAGGWNS